MDTTTNIAIYGAVLSTGLFIWTIIRDVIQARKQLLTRLFSDQDGAGIYLSNVGYRPITITAMEALDKCNERIGLVFRLKDPFYYRGRERPDKFDLSPLKLEPGDTVWYHLGPEVRQLVFDKYEKINLRIHTGTNKIHKRYDIQVVGGKYKLLETFSPSHWSKQKPKE